MKRFLVGAIATLISVSALAATLNPVQLLNPIGSLPGDAIVSTGASSAPSWSSSVGGPQYNVMAYGAKCDGATNDATTIQNAINAAQAAHGGVINLPAGKTCAIAATLAVTASNVGFKGPSGGFSPNDLGSTSSIPTSGATLKWTGASGGTMMTIIAPIGSTSNLPLMGNSVEGVAFDGNGGLAANGLVLKTVDAGRYRNITFLNFNGGTSLTLSTVQPTSTNFNPLTTADSQMNSFDGVFIQSLNNGAAGASNGFLIGAYAGGGSLTVNASENTFNNMSIYVGIGATGILCQGCDTNHFTSVSIGNLGGTAPALDLTIRVDGANSYPANSNVFDGLVTGNAVVARGQTTFPWCTTGFSVPSGTCTSANFINGLDADNGTPTPIIEPGAQLMWRLVNGFSKGQVFGQIAMSPVGSQALTAQTLVTNETLRIANNAFNNVVLSDATGANSWGINVDPSNNLRFAGQAGAATEVSIPATTATSSTTTGALVLGGGLGLGGNINAGGTITGSSFPSPSLTGTPTAPNATAATNTTQIATTAFVQGVLQAPPGGIGTVTPAAGVFTTLKAGTNLTLTSLAASATAPTIASGFGTSPSITANNGTAAFQIQVGTGGTATSGTLTMPAAAHGWECDAQDINTVSATVFQTKQISSATTVAGFANYNTSGAQAAWGAGDNLLVKCLAF